jgi:hypothetical protein
VDALQNNANVSLALLIAMASVLPRVVGAKKCGKHGVGAIIREMRAELPGNGVGPIAAGRREGVQFLEAHCRQCGLCKMAKA